MWNSILFQTFYSGMFVASLWFRDSQLRKTEESCRLVRYITGLWWLDNYPVYISSIYTGNRFLLRRCIAKCLLSVCSTGIAYIWKDKIFELSCFITCWQTRTTVIVHAYYYLFPFCGPQKRVTPFILFFPFSFMCICYQFLGPYMWNDTTWSG